MKVTNLNRQGRRIRLGDSEFKGIVRHLAQMWLESMGGYDGIAALCFDCNPMGDLNWKERHFSGVMYIWCVSPRDTWNLIRGIDSEDYAGPESDYYCSVSADWSGSEMELDGLQDVVRSGRGWVVSGKADVWDWLNNANDDARLSCEGSWKWRDLHEAARDEVGEFPDEAYLVGALRTCRKCGELGHQEEEKYLCAYGTGKVKCAECGGQHALRGCRRLGFRNLETWVDCAGVSKWIKLVQDANVEASAGSNSGCGVYADPK